MKETEPCEESACAGRVKSLRSTGAGDPTAAAAQMGYSFSLTASQRSHTCRPATYMHLDPLSLSMQFVGRLQVVLQLLLAFLLPFLSSV
ncbi:hypothetical protein MHYP_G00257860 [Metynnis hypsauchen]